MPHGFAVSTVERELDTHVLAVVAGEFQSSGAQANVALVDSNATVATALVVPFAASLERQPMHLQDAADALEIGYATHRRGKKSAIKSLF